MSAMLNHQTRRIVLLLGMVCILGLCVSSAFGQVSYDAGGCTVNATANSVWTIKARWTDADGQWPVYMPDLDVEEDLQPNTLGTHINVRSTDRGLGDTSEQERDRDDERFYLGVGYKAPRPGIRLSWSDGQNQDFQNTPWYGDQKDLIAASYPDDGSPIQIPVGVYITPPGTTFTGWNLWPTVWPGGVPRPLTTVSGIADDNGFQTQVYVPRHYMQYRYSDNTGAIYRATCEVPPVIVPQQVIVSNAQVYLDRELTKQYSDFSVLPMGANFCKRTVESFNPDTGAWSVVAVGPSPEPLWAYRSAILGDRATIIVLDPYDGATGLDAGGNGDNPDPSIEYMGNDWWLTDIPGAWRQVDRAYITYTTHDSDYVLTNMAPLPKASVIYKVPILNSLDGSAKVKFNTGILQLDPTRTDPNDADTRNPETPGLNSPLLGIYLTPNPGSDDVNLFVPGKYTDSGAYGEVRVEKDRLPEAGVADWTSVYVKVSTWGVDAVWSKSNEFQDVRFARRINYFKQPEWMSGVITGAWNGAASGRPSSPADANAYTVTPDIDPNSLHVQSVTGIYLPQVMSGTVYDSTHVTPSDTSKMGMVLGVYALYNQTGTRRDDMHVDPDNPSAITFVSAVYAERTMTGIPVDSKHVKPRTPGDIYRVVSVTVPGSSTKYYDPQVHPWKVGDTEITLDDDMDLPAGTASVTVKYWTRNLYDAEDPALAYRYDAGEPLSRLITLTTPIPEDKPLEGSTLVSMQIVFGVGTGLDRENLYDPNNTNTTFRPGEERITLKKALPATATDVRILFGTDQALETRGVATDSRSVVPPNLWRIGRVSGVYAVLEQDGVSSGGGLAQSTAVIDTSDSTRMRVVPTNAGVINKVLRVYDSSNRDYYGPANPLHPFQHGDSVIKLDKALPSGVSVVYVSYEGLATAVTPFDPLTIRQVLGVYTVQEMAADVVDDTHVAPDAPLSIRSVRGVYATANQSGTADVADLNRLSVLPSNSAIIGKVMGVYDNTQMTGTNYFDPDNPETTFRTGDSVIKLSTPLRVGTSSVTVHYETISLAPGFSPGDSEITLGTPLPQSNPAIDPMPIRVVYVENRNYYNVNDPNGQYRQGDTQVVLDTPLPADAVDITVLYAEAWNRYRYLKSPLPTLGSEPDYAPGESSIPLAERFALPDDARGAVVVYTGQLFSPSYDPLDYNPDDSHTYSLRPFIPGDRIVRLNTLKQGVSLPTRFTGPGALKLCIAYQSDKKVKLGAYTQGGRINLPIPLPVYHDSNPLPLYLSSMGPELITKEPYIDFRVLSTVDGPTVAEPPQEGLVVNATYTVGMPYMGRVTRFSPWQPAPHILPDVLPQISPTGTFTYPSPRGMTSIFAEYRRQEPDSRSFGALWVNLGGKYRGGLVPLYLDPDDGVNPVAGVTFRGAVSAGLNLSNVKQQPSCNLDENSWGNTNRLIFDPRGHPMWYAPSLRANGDGSAKTLVDVPLVGWAYNIAWKAGSAKQNMTVHDSRVAQYNDMINHAGMAMNPDGFYGRDYLISYPVIGSPDPLIPEPADELSSDAKLVDDGSSSTQFAFRCRYMNADGLPPLPWLLDGQDEWNMHAGQASGVVLYLDEKGIGDYQPHFMKPEDPNVGGAGAVYIYRVIPHHMVGVMQVPEAYPWPDTERNYQSLGIGVYHYFFGCSDDLLKFDIDKNGGVAALHVQPDSSEWGYDSYGSSPLDPSAARSVTDFPEINRPANRRYSAGGTDMYDPTIYVDRAELVPGLFGHMYPLAADSHPKVTCELGMPEYDDLNVAYDDVKYGRGRFFGTIDPFYRAVNPLMRWIDGDIEDPLFDGHPSIAETLGATTQTDNVFRIMYKQIDKKKPIYVQVLINNASRKSGTGPEYAYTGYSMSPSPDQGDPSTLDYSAGVWYEYKMKLPPGPHTYFFRAYDGEHIVRFPVRPDKYIYDTGDDKAAKGYYTDGWVPTGSEPSERGTEAYIDNDYFPGPYVNHPCVLTDPSVTPGTGKEGQTFQYKIKYSDADGQAPYSAFVYVEINSRGDVRRFAMVPKSPFGNPAADHAADYIAGVEYVLDTGTIKDFALENGVRRFYFEFTDNWGTYSDPNDIIQGEMTRTPQGTGNWITGPVISGNRAPTLSQGSVTSQDGTANAATLWTFKVNYRDLDNDVPALVKAYLGLQQPDGRTVIWDEGHTLSPSNPSDKVYSDGSEFYFQTRLGAADSAIAATKQYFYAFEAYDGVDWATYYTSSNDEYRSDAAGCIMLDNLERVDSSHYKIRPLIAQQATATSTTEVTPENPGDILRVWGVYRTEDVNRAADTALAFNYSDPGASPGLYSGGAIALTTALPAAVSKAWVLYEAQSPIVGPLPVNLPAPAGVIPDALIYEDYSSAPVAILIDGQKNGWISTDPSQPNDRSVLTMHGLAVFENEPSVKYVTPSDPYAIASVEGLYLNQDLSGENYYDPAALEPPVVKVGTVDTTDASRRTILPNDPDGIAYVTGVFGTGDTDMAGTNYYKGVGYPSSLTWQEAIIVGANTVWPKKPNDIVSIKGLYLSMDANTESYYREDGLASQRAYAYGYLAQASDPSVIKSVLGVYLHQSDAGTNYYNSVAADVEYFYPLTSDLPSGTSTVYINYTDALDDSKWQPALVYVGSVKPADQRPIASVDGAFVTVNYDGQGKPTGVGKNFAVSSTYKNGDVAVQITPTPIGSLNRDTFGGGRYLNLVYKSLPLGFGPYYEYLGSSKDLGSVETNVVYIAYYPRGTVQVVKDRKYITLTTPIPAGVTEVNIRCVPKTFNLGDLVIPVTKDLPVGTKDVYIKYSDVRFTHQFRGQAQQPYDELDWLEGTSHFSPDGWDIGSGDNLWMPGATVDPLTVTPIDPNAISEVNGVYVTQDETGEDYYAGTDMPFYEGDTAIVLGRALPAGTAQVYISYAPRNVHIKGNVADVTSGALGVWLNASRDGGNYLNPRHGSRSADNPKHLRLTTVVPDGTGFLWATCYQKGDYHIDRWNRDIFFLPGKEKSADASIQASYFFGTRMPQVVGANTPPTLTLGKVNKMRGSRGDQYVFSVTYRDLDGPNGQAPLFVRAYVDGKAYEMAPVNQGTPAYREGAVFAVTPPEGLSGGSHKFHFETSDGADVALYDWYDENSATRPTTGQTVRDIDGPWVNNPPDLSAGAVAPNPTTGGINPWDSVDYSVTYTDVDNDEPYFWDPIRDVNDYDSNKNGIPDGEEWSGSPRVWIDSGIEDVIINGTVDSLLDDPMDPGKKRTIVVAGTPGWKADDYAGKLMQITNGVLFGRVYLIQSNTANTLTITTDNLAADGVRTAADGDASTFRINGLLMSKADATQQDFTTGVTYRITVPKLAVGTHKFHFTGRSREAKPQWLLPKLTEAERVPYSIGAKYPSTGDDSGPTVVATVPTNNVAPVVSNTQDSSLFLGPAYQMAAVSSLTEVQASNIATFAKIREARGVFTSANDFALTDVLDDVAKTYYDPRTASPVFKTGDTKLTLTRSLPATPSSTMVQFGDPDDASLTFVTVDAKAVIASVQGVYLASDPTLAGTNYMTALDGSVTGQYDPSSGNVTLGRPLPSGTKNTYVACTIKSGLTWTSAVAVPVYVKYYATTDKTVFKPSDLVAFRASYLDANNDSPSYHDGVQGSLKVIFNDLSTWKPLQLLNYTGSAVSYLTEQQFTTEPGNPPEGTHKYHFEASDGYVTTRWPTSSGGDPAANDYTLKVNYKPVLASGKVEPANGGFATTFTFTVNYKDKDGPGASDPQVYARITRTQDAVGFVRMKMSPKTTTPNYSSGVDYDLAIVPNKLSPTLGAGTYRVVFEATDGDSEDALPLSTTDNTQEFTVREANTAPQLSDGSITPAAGKLNTTFVYKAKYRDPDGDAPVDKTSSTKDVLTVTIDKGTATEQTAKLTKSSTATPTADDYKNGVWYETKQPVSGKKIGSGNHTFEISASDGTADAPTISGTGPVLLIPYFEDFRAVDGSSVNLDQAAAITQADVGKEIVFVGKMKFPDNSVTTPPAQIMNLAIVVTKPDNTSVSLVGNTSSLQEEFKTVGGSQVRTGWVAKVRATYTKGVDPSLTTGKSLTLCASGEWTASVSWAGDTLWDKADLGVGLVSISVGGPMRTVAVADPSDPEQSSSLIDMITPPKVIGSSDVGRVFGYERALDMQIVRWDPASQTYFRYGIQGLFPELKPGQAVWVKPKAAYPVENLVESLVDSGLVSLGNPETPFSEQKKYRVIKTFVRDYDRDTTSGALQPLTISLAAGWNQIGNTFFNWKKNGFGEYVTPREDLGIPLSEVRVRYLSETKSLADAAAAGWVRDYAWRYDAVGKRYVMVHGTAVGAERSLVTWAGYWIRAFVDCDLIIDPTTQGLTSARSTVRSSAAARSGETKSTSELDAPPPVPE